MQKKKRLETVMHMFAVTETLLSGSNDTYVEYVEFSDGTILTRDASFLIAAVVSAKVILTLSTK